MDSYVAEVVPPVTPPTDANWLLTSCHELTRAEYRRILGHEEHLQGPLDRLPFFIHHPEKHVRWLVAIEGPAPGRVGDLGLPLISLEPNSQDPPGEVLGEAEIQLDRHENGDVAWCKIKVADARRRTGVGTRLLEAVEAVAISAGRPRLFGWSESVVSPERELAPVQGFHLPIEGGVRFAQEHGFRLMQTRRRSILDLPVNPELLDKLVMKSVDHDQHQYIVDPFTGPIPEEWLEGYTRLRQEMEEAQETPLELDVVRLDRAWVKRRETAREHFHENQITAIVRLVATGEVIGFSEIVVGDGESPFVEQGATWIRPDHRGNALGWVVKILTMRRLGRHYPHKRRLETWTGAGQDRIRKINATLGYRDVSVRGTWLKELPNG